MKIHVERMPASGLEAAFEVPYTEFEVLRGMAQAGDCVFLSPLVTSFKAIRIRDMVEVKGRVCFSVRLNCSRCLNEFETVLKNDFAVAFVREIPESEKTAGEIALKDEDMGLIAFFGDQIDLHEAVQEQAVMAFPIQFLCRPDCRGLCPKCGSDLNQGDCACEKSTGHPAFSVLKNFKAVQ